MKYSKSLKLKLNKKMKPKSTKFGLGELVWYGFNYTIGITFTAVFASLLFGNGVHKLGVHMIWIFFVEGVIAGTCAWAFSRLSRVHSTNNGAAYIYVRTSYGRFWGWFISFLQYSILPVIVTSQIVSIIRINFTDPGSFLYANWGVWQNLGLDLIGIVIYGMASCVLFFGIKIYKKFVNVSSYIKWATSGLLVVAVIALFALSGTSNYSNIIHNEKLTANSFSQAFISCFFFFLGFETYITIGKNIKNPQRNISLSIVIVMILTTIFYVVITALMIGAVSGLFASNPNLQIFEQLGKKIHATWLGEIGVLIMLFSTISLKANAGMQNALYSGGILEPLAVEGYISPKLAKLNKDKIPYHAALVNLIVTFSLAFFWLIIPDVIQGTNDYIHGAKTPSPVIDYSTITAEASLIIIIIYVAVISIAIKLSFQKKLRHNKLELVAWIAAALFLIWQLVMWFVGLVNGPTGFIKSIDNIYSTSPNLHREGFTELVSNIIQITYVIIVFGFTIIWYFVYYKPKLLKRIANNTQKVLDSEFVIHDDWKIVSKTLIDEIDEYLARNKNIHNGKPNANYKHAKEVLQKIHVPTKEKKPKLSDDIPVSPHMQEV